MIRRKVLAGIFLCLQLIGGIIYAQEPSSSRTVPPAIQSQLSQLPTDSAKVFWLIAEGHKMSQLDLDKTYQYCNLANEIASNNPDPYVRMAGVHGLGVALIQRGDNAEAILLCDSAIATFTKEFKSAYPKLVMLIYNNQGGAYLSVGEFNRALESFVLTQELAEKEEDKNYLAHCYYNIGACFKGLNRPETAENFILKSLAAKLSSGDSSYIASTYISLANLEETLNHNSEGAFEYLKTAESFAIQTHSERELVQVYLQRAFIFINQQAYVEAKEVLLEAKQLALKLHDEPTNLDIYGLLGDCFYHLNELEEAEKHLHAAYQISVQTRDLQNQGEVLYWLSQVKAAAGDSASAFVFTERYQEVKDSLDQINRAQETANAEARFKVKDQQKKTKIERLEKEQALQSRNFIFGFSLIILLLVVLLYWRERLLRRKQKELNQSELTAFTLRLTEKKALIDQLESQLTLIKTSTEQVELPFGQLLEMKILTDEDWKQFQILFSKVYPGFIPKIRKNYAQLTTGDHRLLLLLKLNLANKEIADMLAISLQGVKVARHRLRKKVGLETKDSLEGFVEKM